MKTIATFLVLTILAICLVPFPGLPQQLNSVLILLQRSDLEILPSSANLKIYSFDDDYIFGEIIRSDLKYLKNSQVPFQIIDEEGWRGEYYIVTKRPLGPALDKIQQGQQLFRQLDKVFVKIDQDHQEDFLDANYKYEKITRVEKPFPKLAQSFLLSAAVNDSLVRNIIKNVSAESLRAAVQRLQDFQTRYTYSDSIIPAAQWIYDKYRSLGYTDVKFDTFYINGVAHRNVVATKQGLIYPDSVFMIGGHYDSIVLGGGTDRFTWAPGADDNASGTVGGIEAARIFADRDFEATIKFVAWDAEEVGLIGSEAYANQAYHQKERISLFINLDMIANVNPNDPLNNATIYADNPTMPYAQFMAEMAKTYTTLIPFIPGNSGGSDHRSFQLWGYRALFGQEGDFSPHWHKVTDITGNMDFDYMKEFMQMTLATLIHLAGPADNFQGKPYVKYFSHQIDDDANGSSIGNGNGYIDAGETLELSLTIKNFGELLASNVFTGIVTSSQYANILTNSQSFGSIQSDATATSQNNFVVQISPEAPSGLEVPLQLSITDSKGNSWSDQINLTVEMPEFIFSSQKTSELSGNGDDKIDPGETFDLVVEFKNTGLRSAANIQTILRCNHKSILVLDSLAQYDNIKQSGSGINWNDKFSIEIQSDAKAEIIPFSLDISEGLGYYEKTIEFNLAVGQGKILLVEDDGRFELSHYYKEALDHLGIAYFHWNTSDRGAVVADTLIKYSRVLWYTGSEFNNSLFRYGTKSLESYLDRGGKLFVNGSIFAFSLRDSSFLSEYLKIKYVSFKTDLHRLISVPANSVLGDMAFWLSAKGENNQVLTGEIDMIEMAQPILGYDTRTSEGPGNILAGGIAGAAVANNNYRAVTFAFAWEGIEDPLFRQNVLTKILNWFEGVETSIPGEEVPMSFHLAQNYPNPFNAATKIRFAIPASSYVTLRILNLMGQEIRRLITTDLAPGIYNVTWNGRDEQNQTVSSGIYFYQVIADDFKQTRKMMLIY